MNYIFCRTCGTIQPCRYTPGWISNLATCNVCGTALKGAKSRTCPACHSTLYAPAELLSSLKCPCETSGAGVSQLDEFPPIPCTECSASISSDSHGLYGPCPNCGKRHTAQEISKALYHIKSEHKPIQIKWDNPGQNEILHVHAHAQNIPAYSLLIVGPDQRAIYQSGGVIRTLDSQVYSLFGEDPDIEQLARAIIENQSGLQSIALKIDTKITFFDMRNHEYSFSVDVPLADSAWHTRFSVNATFALSNPEAFSRNAAAMAQPLEFIRSRIESAVVDSIACRLSHMPAECLREGADENTLREPLLSALPREAFSEIRETVNCDLHNLGFRLNELVPVPSLIQASFYQNEPRDPRELMLISRVKSMVAQQRPRETYITDLEELWQTYHNTRAAVMLMYAYCLGTNRSEAEKAIELYGVLRQSKDEGIQKEMRDFEPGIRRLARNFGLS